ncbi:heavy metal translocating P-type ATPase [Cupriavidus basilensis]|uniref:heavy metal translocating P-type ATPase n=1 Tax=Cupriavidus basilensis TaxID=68895 RepID=UPI00075086DC|nr:heavy metal translocating P-type ATPase [Cupriavidus basilensis]
MTKKLRLDIPILLPDVPDSSDPCVERLLAELRAKEGVEAAHLKVGNVGHGPQICVHYDPAVISLSRIRELMTSTGATISSRFGHALWKVKGITHARRARTIASQLRSLPGVIEAEVSPAGLARVEFDSEQTSAARVQEALGRRDLVPVDSGAPKGGGHADHDHDEGAEDHAHGNGKEHVEHGHGGMFGQNTELVFSVVCGALLGTGFAIEKLADNAAGWIPTVLFVGAYFFGGFYTVREAIENLRLRKFEIDTLMLVAATGAASLGAWAEGALLLFLFSLGHGLEHYAMGRAKRAIEALAALAPATARVRRDSDVREVPVEELRVGDVVVVRPNERLPVDGFLVKGTSSVNQAPVTGESIPVDKQPVDDARTARKKPDAVEATSRVFAGTINGAGAIEVEVTRLSSESALAKVVKMVNEAEAQKSPSQRFTEKFERIFVPAVLVLVALLLFAGMVVDEPFSATFYRAMAVLVAASPCALAIATPSAVLSGVARAARGGVLIKGGAPLENLGSLKAIAFDKTGTLTEGRPHITDVIAADGISEKELLTVAVAVESLSDHPLAAAIARDGRKLLNGSVVQEASHLQSLTGRGVTATLDNETVWIGKPDMFGAEAIAPLGDAMMKAAQMLRSSGRTTMIVRHGDRDLGAIGLMDTPRASAQAALQALRDLGIMRMIMISGDHQRAAEAVAKEVGIDEAWGDLMPEDKVEAIQKLREEAKVAMVGDGVNDAPAMANATVGIAMGAAGSDVALETADVALMADDLKHLPFVVGLSRHTRAIILQNVYISLGVVAFLLPATILGLGIGTAVAMHEGSTLIVVFNALRLLAYREKSR